MILLPFTEISKRLKQFTFPDVDLVVGIGRGGIVPASMLAHQLSRPLHILHINYRDDQNTPQRDQPTVLAELELGAKSQRILLVDDVSVTGRTMERAREVLIRQHITTLVLKGSGDVIVFPEISDCVQWPWSILHTLDMKGMSL